MNSERTGEYSGWCLAITAIAAVSGVSCGSSSATQGWAGGGAPEGAATTGSGGSSSSGAMTGAGGGVDSGGGSGSSSGGGMTGSSGSTSSGGGSSSGGASSSGGTAGSDAGKTAGGDAGSTGSGGGSLGDGGAAPSSGCNATSGAMTSPQMINVTDKAGNALARQFYFTLPAGYSAAHPYPLVFAWHYAGGQASTIAGTGFSGRYYGIQPNFPNAIYVAPQGLQGPATADGGPGQTGWPNTNGQDIAFARAMVSWFESNFCVDQSRLMSAGFSYGAIMSHTIACEMPDVFRAVGVMSGALIDRAASCVNHDIAAWITHGDADPMVAYANGVSALNRIVALNHCGSTTQAVSPSPCVQYDGCDSADPVVWCSVAGEGHAIPSFAATAIASFFAQF